MSEKKFKYTLYPVIIKKMPNKIEWTTIRESIQKFGNNGWEMVDSQKITMADGDCILYNFKKEVQ